MKSKSVISVLALVLGLAFTLTASAQTTTTYAIGQQPVCSPGGSFSCIGIPLISPDGGNDAFMLSYAPGWPYSHQVSFEDNLTDLGQPFIDTNSIQEQYSNVTAVSSVTHYTYTGYEPTTLSFNYSGKTQDGRSISGSMTINFTYYYVDRCSGRACGGTLGWHKRVAGGTATITVQ